MADTMIYIPAGTITLTTLNPIAPTAVPVAAMQLMPLAPYPLVEFTAERIATARAIYKCVLTGEADGLDDLEIPIASFTATVRDGDPTYLSCRVPAGATYDEAVEARSNGEIVISSGLRFADGTEYLEEIARADFEYAGVERIASDYSLTLVGHATQTTGQSKEYTLSGVSYYSEDSAGKRRVRCGLDFRVRCGDICTYGDDLGEELIVGSISYSVAAYPAMAVMEIAEV